MVIFLDLVSLFIVPALVFSIQPETNTYLRIVRLIAAILLCYGLAGAAAYWHSTKEWDSIDAFRKEFPHCENKPCPNEPTSSWNGPALGLLILFGWIPAASYTGFCELLWQWYYRQRLRAKKPALWINIFSAILILFWVISVIPLSKILVYPQLVYWFH